MKLSTILQIISGCLTVSGAYNCGSYEDQRLLDDPKAKRIMLMSEERLRRAEEKRRRKGWVKNETN